MQMSNEEAYFENNVNIKYPKTFIEYRVDTKWTCIPPKWANESAILVRSFEYRLEKYHLEDDSIQRAL